MRAGVRSFLRQDPMLLVMLALALIAVTGAYWTSVVPQIAQTTTTAEPPRIQWLPEQNAKSTPAAKLRSDLADLLDPSLMSLPNERGFSKPMWQRGVAANQRAIDWHNEPAFLDAKPTGEIPTLLQQRPLVEYVQSTAHRAPAISEENVDDQTGETLPVVNESVFRALTGLDARPVVRAPRLPRLVSDTPVRPTRVRVGVASDGTVRFATVERASGDDAVDAKAVELARQIRFEPQGGSDTIAWGVLRFLWAMGPPPATSDAPAVQH